MMQSLRKDTYRDILGICISALLVYNALPPVPYGNRACSGGSVETSLMYIIDSGGLNTENYYPYKERVIPSN